MAESPTHDATNEEDDLASAAQALTQALDRLTRAIGTDAQAADPQAASAGRHVLALSLREASRELAVASDALANVQAGQTGRPESTRDEILAAARRIFARKGYEGASVTDIAATAGFTKGALYANFPSKEALFLAVAHKLAEEQITQFAEYKRRGAEPTTWYEDARKQTLEDTLLNLELWTYAVRHRSARAELAASWRNSLAVAANLAAHMRGRSEATTADIDFAFGMSAIYSFVQITGTFLGPEVAAIGERLIRHLLSEETGEAPPKRPGKHS